MKQPKHNPNDDKIIISSEYYEDDRPVFICSICSRTLTKLTDAGQNNTMFFCIHCSVEFDPENENVRRESRLTVPDRNIEPSVTSVDVVPDVSIHHEPELSPTFKALQKKGLKITDYKESVPGKKWRRPR